MNAVVPADRKGPTQAEAWMASLAPLVSPVFPKEVAAALREYLPLLRDVPGQAFNRDTLEEAARCAKGRHGVPTYAELRAVLAAWCREHRPVRPALPRPRDAVPEEERCTPEQAAEILRRHGWVPPPEEPKPARASDFTWERRGGAPRPVGFWLAETGLAETGLAETGR
jgi:hypothetical protein